MRKQYYITCEQCGNDFGRGKIINKDGMNVVYCPYCRYENPVPHIKRPKKGVRD